MRKLLSVLFSTLKGGVRWGLLSFLLVASVSAIYASDTQVDGIWYDFDSSTMTASVTYQGNSYHDYYGEYSGSVIIPETVIYNGTTYSVTSIGERAFSYCHSLSSVTIPNSVTSIGEAAFSDCSSLTSVTIPNSVTNIGNSAFADCTSLTSVTIPNRVTSIGNRAFSYCFSLTSITIPNSVTNIGNNAFSYCSSLTSITIPNSVTNIGSYAFSGCSALTSITIPESITSIGSAAFSGCESITKANYTGDIAGWCKIKFGNVDANPIYYSHNLYINDQEIKDLVIPNTVDSIRNYAFYECFSLNSVTIPNSVKSIGYNTFQNCCFLKKDFVNNSSLDAEEKGYWGALVGESEVDGLIIQGTTVVGCRKNVTAVTIPNNITNIGKYAFAGCSSLTSITIPKSVTSVGSYAFSNCDSLTKTNYTGDIADWCDIKFDSSGSNPMSYSQNLYINDQEIKDLVIPNSVDSIHDYAFCNGSALSTVSLSNSVTNIGNRAFYSCSSLSSVTIPNSVTSIGDNAFNGCSSLTSVILSEGLTSIGNWAFSGCSSLTSITIPNNVIYIGYWAFQNTGIYNDESNWENNELYIDDCLIAIKYSSITGSYTIKDGVRLIAGGAFWEQYGLTEVIIPNSVKSISTRAFSNTEITSIVIPNSVTNIEQMTFYNCKNLSSVTLGSGLTCIEDRVFEGCTALASINIPQGVSSVGKRAFRQCSSLDTIFLTSQIPPTLDATAFQNAAQPICYVPCGTLAEYQASSWVNYVDTLVEVCDNELFYTSTDGAIVTPDNTAFGAKIVDNTYSNGQGVITFDRPITTLGQYAFYACDNLASIIIPETITEIGNYAFKYCSALSSIIIPNTVIEIGYDAFYACSSLTSITIPNSVTSIGEETFSGCSALTEVNIPNNVTRIEENTFSGCSALTEIAIPNSVTYIGESAFEDCIRLGKVQIGSGVETIAENAFAGCRRLYDVYCYATYPPFAEQSSFANYNVYLYVPCESIRNYTLDVVWGNFKFIECIASEDVTTEGVVVTPSTNDVTITWPTEGNADTYTIVIKKGDTVFCTLTFNADGQLLNIAFAPGRNGNHPAQYAEQAGNGYRFTVTGLDEGTHYAYNIDVNDAANKTIKSYTGEFTTESVTSVENIHGSSSITNCQKMIRNGQFVIVRDGVEYTIMGQEL